MTADVDYVDLNGKPKLIKSACPTLRLKDSSSVENVRDTSEMSLNSAKTASYCVEIGRKDAATDSKNSW
ncbi:hypothetical protein Bhyg_07826 [Pseudolycoriella hygida]|uniref:Uncharacterized protein n=1 Tax=Pseudolycoriella hygida TaxID=35572 RepID=A0A9Q0S4B7_9DIPT|nr:hypothetical protein Bhyg_07826 [Pseudolycoriella hygida]